MEQSFLFSNNAHMLHIKFNLIYFVDNVRLLWFPCNVSELPNSIKKAEKHCLSCFLLWSYLLLILNNTRKIKIKMKAKIKMKINENKNKNNSSISEHDLYTPIFSTSFILDIHISNYQHCNNNSKYYHHHCHHYGSLHSNFFITPHGWQLPLP
jgi:hypothetical protein